MARCRRAAILAACVFRSRSDPTSLPSRRGSCGFFICHDSRRGAVAGTSRLAVLFDGPVDRDRVHGGCSRHSGICPRGAAMATHCRFGPERCAHMRSRRSACIHLQPVESALRHHPLGSGAVCTDHRRCIAVEPASGWARCSSPEYDAGGRRWDSAVGTLCSTRSA